VRVCVGPDLIVLDEIFLDFFSGVGVGAKIAKLSSNKTSSD
jgi:hypothetical protein